MAKYVWQDGKLVEQPKKKPKKPAREVELVRNIADGAPRKTFAWRDGKLVEIDRACEEFSVRRPGRKNGMFVPRTMQVGPDTRLRISPGKKTRERIRREGWRP